MSVYYPPLGFHFLVEFGNQNSEYQFQSVAGLSIDLETEEIAEGGENRFKHKIPGRPKYPNLILKRGLLVDSSLLEWCKEATENFNFSPTNILVKLLNKENEPLVSWNVVNAYPVKWSVSDLNAEESKLVIETIELSYSYFNTL